MNSVTKFTAAAIVSTIALTGIATPATAGTQGVVVDVNSGQQKCRMNISAAELATISEYDQRVLAAYREFPDFLAPKLEPFYHQLQLSSTAKTDINLLTIIAVNDRIVPPALAKGDSTIHGAYARVWQALVAANYNPELIASLIYTPSYLTGGLHDLLQRYQQQTGEVETLMDLDGANKLLKVTENSALSALNFEHPTYGLTAAADPEHDTLALLDAYAAEKGLLDLAARVNALLGAKAASNCKELLATQPPVSALPETTTPPVAIPVVTPTTSARPTPTTIETAANEVQTETVKTTTAAENAEPVTVATPDPTTFPTTTISPSSTSAPQEPTAPVPVDPAGLKIPGWVTIASLIIGTLGIFCGLFFANRVGGAG